MSSLTHEQRALLPDDADVAFYEANGYYISKAGVLPDALIDSAFEGAQRFYRGERDGTLPLDTGFSNWRSGDGDGPRNNEFVSLQKRELKDLAVYPLLGAIAAKLTRSSVIRVLDDQLIYKPSDPGNAASTVTGWHADRAYWATCSSDQYDLGVDSLALGGGHSQSARGDGREPSLAGPAGRSVLQSAESRRD